MNMKKFLVICIGVAVVSSNSATLAKANSINFCTTPNTPFVITDKNNKLAGGFDVELAKAICKKIGTECNFNIQQKRAMLLASLNSGECDVWTSGLTISPERKKHMNFTDAYYSSAINYMASKNSVFTSSAADFNGKKVGVVDGSSLIPYLEITYGNNIKIIRFANDNVALEALKANEVDTVISDTIILQHWMQQKGNNNFRLINLLSANKELSLGEGYGMAVKKSNTELLVSLNKALAEIKSSDTYNKMVKKYFIFPAAK